MQEIAFQCSMPLEWGGHGFGYGSTAGAALRMSGVAHQASQGVVSAAQLQTAAAGLAHMAWSWKVCTVLAKTDALVTAAVNVL